MKYSHCTARNVTGYTSIPYFTSGLVRSQALHGVGRERGIGHLLLGNLGRIICPAGPAEDLLHVLDAVDIHLEVGIVDLGFAGPDGRLRGSDISEIALQVG